MPYQAIARHLAPRPAWATASYPRVNRERLAATCPCLWTPGTPRRDAIPMLVRGGDQRPCASLPSRWPALLPSGTASEALAIGTTLLRNRATDLADQDTSRSEARQVESHFDGHPVG
jgi:hypothetical protein